MKRTFFFFKLIGLTGYQKIGEKRPILNILVFQGHHNKIP